jgi:hypothetical protein
MKIITEKTDRVYIYIAVIVLIVSLSIMRQSRYIKYWQIDKRKRRLFNSKTGW